MKFEHAAFQVADPPAMARWYAEHLGAKILRRQDKSPFAHFLGDSDGRVYLEIYRNEAFDVPDYAAIPPAHIHMAFEVGDVPAEHARLLAAGATVDGEMETTPSGDVVTMLRDPWGFTLQLVCRAKPMTGA